MWRGAVQLGGVQPGEHVVVTGAGGGVGSAAVALLSAYGCKVVGVTGDEKKVEHVRACGASEVVVAAPDQFHKSPLLSEQTSMVVECVGAPTFKASLRALAAGNLAVGQY